MNPFVSVQNYGEYLLNRMESKAAVRTGIAAGLSWFISVAIAKALSYPNTFVSGLWCVLTAIVTLQAHLGGTYKEAWMRFLGVILGSCVGAVCTSAFGAHPLSLAISITLTVCLLSLFNLHDSIRIACMSLSVVMILWGLNPTTSPWTFAFFRSMDSVLGIIVAVAVAHTVWPSEAAELVRERMAHLLHISGKLYPLMVDVDLSEEAFKSNYTKILNEADRLVSNSREILRESKLEMLIKYSPVSSWDNLIDEIEKTFQKILGILPYRTYKLPRIFDEELSHHVDEVTHLSELAIRELSQALISKRQVNSMDALLMASSALDEDLNRFRTTRTTRKFNFEDLENYFVFFFNLKQIIYEIIDLKQKIDILNKV